MPIDRTPDQGEVLHQPDPPPFPKQPGSDEEGTPSSKQDRVPHHDAEAPDAREIAKRPSLPSGVPHMPADD